MHNSKVTNAFSRGRLYVKIAIFIIIVVIIALIIRERNFSVLRDPSYQGEAGENYVAYILSKLPEDYYSINNVIIPSQNGTSQIDHVVVSPFGIFVIETKNYKGWIFGYENSKKWKETFKTTDGSYFWNPIKQNWGHVYALSEYLNLNKRVFWPIVVFSDECELNVETTTPVIYMSQLNNLILSHEQEIIPAKEVESIYNRIKKVNLVGTDIGNQHTQRVKKNMEQKRASLREGKCPQCGGNLVLRDGKYGQFYGCSNYPKCKFTQNIRN